MSWIFQAIPRRYDLRKYMHRGERETWLVTRYGDEMAKNQIVYFWLAGPVETRGIYGWGRIEEQEPKYFKDWGYGIRVKYESVFPTPLLSETIRLIPGFSDHLLFRVAIGTNFRLTDEQDHNLRDVIKNTYGPGEVPHD